MIIPTPKWHRQRKGGIKTWRFWQRSCENVWCVAVLWWWGDQEVLQAHKAFSSSLPWSLKLCNYCFIAMGLGGLGVYQSPPLKWKCPWRGWGEPSRSLSPNYLSQGLVYRILAHQTPGWKQSLWEGAPDLCGGSPRKEKNGCRKRWGCAQKANQGSLGFGRLSPPAHLYPEPQNQTGWIHETTAASSGDNVPSELTGRGYIKAANY